MRVRRSNGWPSRIPAIRGICWSWRASRTSRTTWRAVSDIWDTRGTSRRMMPGSIFSSAWSRWRWSCLSRRAGRSTKPWPSTPKTRSTTTPWAGFCLAEAAARSLCHFSRSTWRRAPAMPRATLRWARRTSPPWTTIDAKGHLALGAAYFASMDYDRCRAEMSGIAKDPKTEAGAAYYLGRVARMDENYDEALTYLERAIKLVSSFAEAYTELARVRIGQGQLAAARTAVDRALALDPESFLANSALLTVLQLTHDSGAAQQAARLRTLDAERSRRRELLLRTIEVKPY